MLVEEGAMRGMNIIVDTNTGNVTALSTRYCKDAERWRDKMPSIEHYPNLQTLDLDNSRYLVELDDSVGSLADLNRLILTRCERLERLPDSLGNLCNLQEVRSGKYD